ncbi:MAG: 4Fe-4S dicluster domain-containing protein [Candidatus Thorarchaeota archaeon]
MREFLTVDIDLCTGCRNCELACSVRHTSTFNPRRARIQVIRDETRNLVIPVVCLQCEHPLCLEACPTGSLHYNEAGVLTVDETLCIGCGNCVTACKYGGITLDPIERYAIKCDLCGGDPACVSACEYGAIQLITAETEGLSTRSHNIERAANILGIAQEEQQ